jgi:hypothetical protein
VLYNESDLISTVPKGTTYLVMFQDTFKDGKQQDFLGTFHFLIMGFCSETMIIAESTKPILLIQEIKNFAEVLCNAPGMVYRAIVVDLWIRSTDLWIRILLFSSVAFKAVL